MRFAKIAPERFGWGTTRGLQKFDPNKDSLHEVILYLKDFADKLFDRTGVAFRVQGLTPDLEKVKLSADAKRHLTLIFKEGMTNILKHAVHSHIKSIYQKLQVHSKSEAILKALHERLV